MAKKTADKALEKQLKLITEINGEAANYMTGVTEDSDLSDVTDEQAERIVYLTDDELLDDPMNKDYYGSEDDGVDELAFSMKNNGFQGCVLAYPRGDGKYVIESGHRRREAARRAGISKYRVFVTEPPKSDWERMMRLFNGNLLARKEDPMTQARVAEGVYQAQVKRREWMKENGIEIPVGESPRKLAATYLATSTQNLDRLRCLLKLEKCLKEDVETGLYPWSDISDASSLEPEKQEILSSRIRERTKTMGSDYVTRKWIRDETAKLRERPSSAEAEELAPKPEETKSRGDRSSARRYGVKTVLRGASDLRSMLDAGTAFKNKDVPEVISTLEQLKASIDNKLNELRNAD